MAFKEILIFSFALIFTFDRTHSAPEGAITGIADEVANTLNDAADSIESLLDVGSGEAGNIERAIDDVVHYVVNGTRNSIVDAANQVNKAAGGTAVHLDNIQSGKEGPVQAIAGGIADVVGDVASGAEGIATEIFNGIKNIANLF